jgi:muramidase (phage lysozyme)
LPFSPQQRLSLLASLALFSAGPLPAGSQAIPAVQLQAAGTSAQTATATQPAKPAQVSAGAANGEPYALSPRRRALLDTIRFAEGTWHNGRSEGYRTLYGGGLFHNLARHPEITVRRRYTSAAAGAYQFLPGTWREVASRLRLSSFEPHNQDQAALHLIERRGALNLLDRGGLSRDLLARLAPEWASLPTRSGGSHYGQPVKSYAELSSFYSHALRRHGAG